MTDRQDQSPFIINVPAEEQQRDLIDQAAEYMGRSREGFVLDAACREAAGIVLDQVFFPLSSQAFAEFQSMRDNPPEPTDALRRLLLRNAPWE